MGRRLLCVALAWAMAAPLGAQSPPAAADPDVAKGIQQVEEGDYDAAILTLDNAARRLAAEPARSRELSQAYLYLGVAYVGKGHEAAAKAKFREAVRQIRDLTLSPEKFPPKVIDLFEAAREEASRAAAPAASPSPAPARPAPVAEKKGGSKLPFIIGGLALAGGGAALALKGGGDDSCDTAYLEESGVFNANSIETRFTTTPAEAGHWRAKVNWVVVSTSSPPSSRAANGPRGALPIGVKVTVDTTAGVRVAESRLLTETESHAEWDAGEGTQFVVVLRLEGGGGVSWDLVVEGPCVF